MSRSKSPTQAAQPWKQRSEIMTSLNRVKNSLSAIERNIPDEYGLFAHHESLYLINIKTDEILYTIELPCDGGDPDTVEVNGKWYLKR